MFFYSFNTYPIKKFKQEAKAGTVGGCSALRRRPSFPGTARPSRCLLINTSTSRGPANKTMRFSTANKAYISEHKRIIIVQNVCENAAREKGIVSFKVLCF